MAFGPQLPPGFKRQFWARQKKKANKAASLEPEPTSEIQQGTRVDRKEQAPIVREPRPADVPKIPVPDIDDSEDEVDDVADDLQMLDVAQPDRTFHYWWFQALDDASWKEVVDDFEGYDDLATGTRRCKKEVPQWHQQRLVRTIQRAPEAMNTQTLDGRVKMYVEIVYAVLRWSLSLSTVRRRRRVPLPFLFTHYIISSTPAQPPKNCYDVLVCYFTNTKMQPEKIGQGHL